MNLNDPFGRMQAKHQKEYESLRDSFKEMSLNTPDDAQALIEKLKRRSKTGVVIIAAVTLILSLLLPELLSLILISGAVALFWLIKTSQKSQEYVKKYVKEELGDSVKSDEEMQEQNKE